MLPMIHTCALLGERLAALEVKSPVVQEACRENPWFMPHEVVRAAHVIADTMLRPELLERWLAAYPLLPHPNPCRVGIIMAGNIPLVGFFDLLAVLVAGHRAVVKPSSKDNVLIAWVVDQLLEIDAGCPVEWMVQGQEGPQAIIATGSDNAIMHLRSSYGDLPALLRGSRQSVAVLDGTESEAELRGLEEDIFAYSGLGCRNVSLILLPEGVEPRLRLPEMNPLYLENYRHQRALRQMLGLPFCDLGGALLVDGEEFSSALSLITLKRYTTLEEVQQWLEQHDREIQCVVGRAVKHPRRADFGMGQCPSLWDYPDQVDLLAFLADL